MKYKLTVHIFLRLIIEIIFPFTLHYPKTPVPVVNNPIRLISPRPRQGTNKPDAYGAR